MIFKKHQLKSVKGVFVLLSVLVTFSLLTSCGSRVAMEINWSELSQQEKPWTRWWWMGSSVDKASITAQMESFAEAGLGGVEITPIYGTQGYEDAFIDYLSPEWMEMLEHTVSEGERLGLGVDMVLGTGWPFGGPQVEPQFAASKLYVESYHIDADETFSSRIELEDPRQRGIAELQYVIYYDAEHKWVDLTPLLDEGKLNFTPSVETELYAIFCGKTRQRVKRSAPGGEGYTLDHFSKAALEDYLLPYNEVMEPFRNRLRAIFNDSYEVYNADYTPDFLSEFKQRRGYDLLDHIDLLVERPDSEEYRRVLCDYRETLSDLLLEDFAQPWDQWSNTHSFKTKYQAHGSPGNLVDLYAAADIPETEIFGSPEFDIPGYRRDTNNVRHGDSNKMMLKFTSSAAHLKGDELVSSESFTWLREHFKTALSQCKPVADDFFLSGVNHMFLHGSTFSPKDDPWPGFKFYASVNFNSTNNIWHDAPYLFEYIGRCQSILQKAENDNDILLYWPVHDAFTNSNQQRLLYQFGIHSIDEWLLHTPFYKIADQLDKGGYGFDFISDTFVQRLSSSKDLLLVDGKADYKTIIVPEMEQVPLETMEKLLQLKEQGAAVIFMGKAQRVPGLHDYVQREQKLKAFFDMHSAWFEKRPDLFSELKKLGIIGEDASKVGLKILRKKLDNNYIYFVANHSDHTINDYVTFNKEGSAALLMDPMTGEAGLAKVKKADNATLVKLYMEPGQSLFITLSAKSLQHTKWKYPESKGPSLAMNESWDVEFISGGEEIPAPLVMNELQSWTRFGTEYEAFSGTARYSTNFILDETSADGYTLELEDIRESARVYVNGDFAGALIAHPFSLDITDFVKEGKNEIQIEVTNLSANRLRQLELSGKEWKKFYEINMVNIHYKPFDAKVWNPLESGLLGEVKIVPVNYEE